MNKLVLSGRLTKDVEIKQANNTTIAKFTIAVRKRMGKDGASDFFNIVAFGNNADFVAKYFGKGQQISVCGRLQNNNYEDNEGKKHYSNEIIAEEIYFVGNNNKKEDAPADASNNINADDQYDFTPNFIAGDDDLPF